MWIDRLAAHKWLLPLVVFVGVLAVYAPTVSPVVNTDVAANSLTAWRIAQTGEPWMEGLDLTEGGEIVHYKEGANGHIVTVATPGTVWLGTPFYLGSSAEQDDHSYIRGGLAAASASAAAVAMMFMALWTRSSTRTALGAVTVFALATPMWSVNASSLWTHAVTVPGIAGAAWALSRDRWALAGVGFGIAILGRPHVALVAAVIGLGLAWSRRSPLVAVRIGLTSFSGLALLLLWNQYVHDSWNVSGGYNRDYATLVPDVSQGGYLQNLAGFFISPDRGFFVWTPLALLLLPAVARSWREIPSFARWLAIGGVGYTLAQVATAGQFHGGDAFYGYRLALELLVCVTPLYVFALPHVGRLARRTALAVVGIQFAALSMGSIVEGIWLSDDRVWADNSLLWAFRQEPVWIGIYLFTAASFAWLLARWVVASEAQESGEPPARRPQFTES